MDATMPPGRRDGSMTDVTRILSAIEEGDAQAAEQLLPLVYEELRKLAAQKMVNEQPGQTLQATALVHEAYLRLVDGEKVQHWNIPKTMGVCYNSDRCRPGVSSAPPIAEYRLLLSAGKSTTVAGCESKSILVRGLAR
jgi:hypothetical protein